MPDRMPGRKTLIHFKKYRSLHRIIKPLLAMQSRQYAGIKVNRPLINLLSSAVRPYYFHFMEDRDKVTDRLHKKSVLLEPPVAALPDEEYYQDEYPMPPDGEQYQ